VSATLKVLLVEDSALDAELAMRELKRAGLGCTGLRVDTEPEFLRALGEFQPHVILSDFSMPRFDGMAALAIAHEQRPEVPFIFVSGTLGEEYAIRALKSGATDYVLKSNLVRLPPTVERAVQEAQTIEQQRSMQLALSLSEQRYKLAASTGDLWDWTLTTGEAYMSHQWKARLGYQDHEIPNTTEAWLSLLHPEDLPAVLHAVREHITKRTPCEVEYRTRTKQGGYRWLQSKGQATWDETGRATYMAGTVADITERKLAEIKVRRLNRVYAMLSGINALTVRVRNPTELFREACRIAVEAGQFRLAWIGLADPAAGVVRPVAWHGLGDGYVGLMPLGLHRGDPATYGLTGQAYDRRAPVVIEDIEAEPHVQLKEEARARGFRSLAVLPLQVSAEVVGTLTLYSGETGFFDAEELKLLGELCSDVAFALDYIDKADKLSQLAYCDTLTGLPNRRLLMDRLRRAQLNSIRQRMPFAVLFIDLDDFKRVNDRFGHDTGDKLLIEVARRLSAAVRQNDTVARLGGDEFVVILEDLGATEDIASSHAEGIARKIHDLLAQEHSLDGERHYCSASVGIELLNGSDCSVEQILKDADAAMYRDKRARRPD
jgi:diguanylate cyclase (GGDEF)-like protein/PAS domain S-box-containing protein